MTQEGSSRYPSELVRENAADSEIKMLEAWKEADVFRRTIDERQGEKPFVFYEGPPTANGKPGVHHVLARTVKDLVCRYQTMRGRLVLRRGGWDTHGLPVELEVEKQLGISNKREIVERVGIEEFNRRCRESVFTYLTEWRELTERIGYWVDLEDEYVTLRNDYIESVWNLLKTIHDQKLIYRGFKIVPYSTKSGTTLSDHEVALGYKEVDDPSVTVRFPIRGEENAFFLVWTTTPWTLPGNTGLAVNADLTYVRVRHGDEELVLAKDLLAKVVTEEHEVLREFPGSELVGMSYEPLFPYYASRKDRSPNAFTVCPGEFVTVTDGTGIVHMAPGFGADDLEMGRLHQLPVVTHVNDEGEMLPEVEVAAGLWFKDADKPILKNLRERGLVFHAATYRHTYPFNWRGKDPLMYVAREAWYIRTTDIKDRLVESNQEIFWMPDHIRAGRFGNWLENNVDWALSRERFWGTPLPIWVSDRDPDHFEVVGSVEELSKKSGRDLKELDLHRPYVDEITWPDGQGGTMRRVPEVLDVWFDSGAMPFAQWHAPFENEEMAKSQFPADFICEGLDQTRGWFYSLHAIANLVRESVAYKSCYCTGLLMGEDGQKMSKSIGNTVDPWEAVGIGGADSLRWFMTVTNNPSGTMRFSKDGVREVSRKIMDTLRNLYAFFAQYANLDDYAPATEPTPLENRALLDRWILSRRNGCVARCVKELDRLEVSRAGRAIESFVIEDLSNWYVRRSRDRFWAEGLPEDKRAAYDTLFECLETVSKLMAPYAPFLSDIVHQGLSNGTARGADSVHLERYPEVDESQIDEALEARMEKVRRIVRLGRAGRNRSNVKTRQPLSQVKIIPPAGESAPEELFSIVLDELNVKEAVLGTPGEALSDLSAKARFDVLGPRFGKGMKQVAQAIAKLPTEKIQELEREGHVAVTVGEETHDIERDEVNVSHSDPEGWVLERERGWSVALDLAIDDELRGEGFAREIVNKIQFMRRKADFEITERVIVYLEGTDPLRAALDAHRELVASETQADEIHWGAGEGDARDEWDINGEPAVIVLRRVPSGQVLER